MALHPKVKQLYDTLKGGGADVGTEQEFNSWFFASGNTGYQNRKQVWQTLKDGGADAGNSYEEFAGWLGLHAVKSTGGVNNATNGTGQSMLPADVAERRVRTRNPHPLDRKKAERQLRQNEQAIGQQQKRWQKQSDRQKKYVEQRTSSVPGGMERVEDRAKEYLATGEASPVPIAPNPEVVRGDMVMDENGQMQQSYMTPTGDYSSRAGAEAVEYRNAHPLEDELQQAYMERERLQEELGRAGNEAYNTYVGSGAGFMPLAAQGAAMHNSPEFSMLSSAYNQNELRIKTLERERDADGFWRTLGKELFSLDTWDFGAQEFMDAGNLLRFGEGENLTDEQQEARETMLLNTFRRQGADQQYGENDTFMQSSATITANAIPFVVQFLATGGMEAITAGGAKLGSKMAAKAAAKGFTGKVSQWVIRNTGVAAGDVAAGFLMANTVGGLATGADIMGRHQGQVVQGPDGMLRFEGGKSWGRSIYEGEVANTLEYYTEMLGAHMDGMGTAIGALFSKGAGKVSKTAAGKGLQELADKVGITKLSELFSRIKGSEFRVASSHLLKSGGVNEIPSEILEEEANLILNAALVGDNQWSDLKDWDKTQRDIIGGMFLSVGFMQSPGTIGGVHQAAQYYRYKQNTDIASARASALFGADRWNALKEGLDESTNGDFMDIVHTVLIDESITDEHRGAVVEYAKNVLKMRGYNLRTLADAKDKADEGSSSDDEAANSYHEGYNMPDEEQAGVKERVDVARQVLYQRGYTDDDINALDGLETLDGLDEAALEYVNAQAAYEGMLQHVQDDMEGAIAESEAAVDAQTHIETGAVHHAVLKTGGEVWVVGGNVALTPEGNIDIENSDGDLIVLDPATGGKRMIHVSKLASVDEPVMADQLKQEAAATIQETMATEAANRIDGVLPFQPGDEYTLPFGEEQHTIQVIADGEDGVNVVVSVDGGEQRLMPRQMIQDAADAQREARIAEQAAMEAAASQQQPVEQEPEATEEVTEEPVEEEQPDEDDMPMNGDEVDWFATSPERGRRFLYDEAGLSPEEADAVVANSVKDAEKELEKVSKKAPKPGNAAQLNKYRAEKEAHEQQVAAAQAAVDYWKGVQATQQQVVADLVRRQADERAAQDAAARQAAIEAEAQYQAEQEAKKAEQAERGPFTPGQNVIDKWKSAKKIDGRKDVKVLADGTVVAGHYVLHEAGATTPSHDPATGWKPTEGFPVNENGGSVNDRDYERDRAAQEITIRMSETFDGRAYQDVPIISDEGIDYSGNGRTIAGDMAARNNTDGAYLETARQYSEKYGFTAEDMDQFQHPRVDFMLDKKLPYTPEVFAKFNAQEMKGQNLTESAVKLGKTVDDTTFNDIVGLINQFDTMSDFYADGTAPAEAISMLLRAGVITPMQHAQMFDGDSVSGQGKEMLENLLLGKAFEGNPEAIRQIRSMPSVRQQIVGALAEVANNSTLGDYSLEDVISQAVALVHKARNDKNSSVKQGDSVSDYARQLSLFPNITGGATIADLQNTMVLLLGDILNGRGQLTFKNVLIKYNYSASQTVGYTGSFFTDASPEGLLKDAIQLINNSNKNEIKQEITAAVEQRKSAARQGSEPVTAVNTGDEGGAAGSGAERDAEGQQSDLASPEVSYQLSDEVDENGRQFVLTSNGELEFGQIGEDTGLTAAPILLSEGIITNPETNDGYGLVHIEARHGDQIRNAGYHSVIEFIEEVAKNYEVIRKGKDRNGMQTYMLQLTDKHNNTLIVELSGDGTYWNINTAGIFKTSYGAKREVVYNRHTTAKQPAETAGASLTGEQSGTTPETSMNAPTTSEGKGSTENANVQGNSEKNVDQSVAQAEAEVDTEPTDDQKEAGNYKKGHVKIDGFDVTIEQPKGSVRSGVDASGKAWSQEMHNTYGYIRGTEGVDGDHIDVFLSDHLDNWNGMVYVVDQVNKDGSFDEHKVMYGFNSEQEARDAYLSNYKEGWTGLGNITGVTREEFKKWVDSSHRKTKPFAEYKSVKAVEGAAAGAAAQEDTAAGEKKPKKPATKQGKLPAPSAFVKGQVEAIAQKLSSRDEVRGTIEDMPREADLMRPFYDWIKEIVVNPRSGYSFDEKVDIISELMGNKERSADENTERSLRMVRDIIKRTKAIIESGVTNAANETAQPEQAQASASENASKPASEGPKRLVSDDRMAELKERLRKKLGGQLNVGIDPELLMIGTELAVGHIERGLTKFADYAKAMVEDIGDVIRPYLKSFYNAVRDMPEAADYADELTPYDEVRQFDVANFDKEGPKDIIATAHQITNEQKAESDTLKVRHEQAVEDGKKLRPATQEDIESGKTVYYNGEPHRVMMIVHHGEQIGPAQFSKPTIKRVYLDNGKDVSPDDLFVMDEGKATAEDVQAIKDILKGGKKKKSGQHEQGTVPSLFGDMLDEKQEEKDAADVSKPRDVEEKPAEELAGDSAEHQERAKQEDGFVGAISAEIIHRANEFLRNNEGDPLKMSDVKRMLEDYPLLADYSTTDLQELVELAMTRVTRNTAVRAVKGNAEEQRRGYAKVVAQYLMQPLLNARDSTRIERQQYSTPTPFGYVMGQFLQAGRRVDNMLEPSAGNGALTITFQPGKVHVNDIDERRLANLRTLGYGHVTSQNGLLPFKDGVKYSAVATNPPFGSVAEREYDGGIFRMTSLEGQMAINALDSMADNGRAAIIIGGNTEYRENGVMKAKDMAFFSYLYSHYHVVDVINIDGAMYSRNGTKFPVRIILVDGRKQHDGEFTKSDRVVPPVRGKARAEQVKTFDELYNRVQDDILQIQQNGQESADTDRPAETPKRVTGTPERTGDHQPATGKRREPVSGSQVDEQRPAQPSREPAERPDRGGDARPSVESRPARVDHDHGGNAGRPAVDAGNQAPGFRTGPGERSDSAPDRGGRAADSSRPASRPAGSRERLSVAIGDEKVAYPNQSASGTLMSVVPANQADAITKSLESIGDVDQFLVDQLGYSSKDELYGYLAAEQIDSVALAITQMNNGKGFIIGDMTGVGKGRQGAALIRYAIQQGKVPIYFTQKASLFSDNYRDLSDIGSGGLRPFIIGSSTDANITDANGNIVHRLPSKKEQQRVFDYINEHGTLPEEYDYVITTYSQIQTGTVDYEAKGDQITPTARKGKRAKVNAAALSGQRKRDALSKLAAGNMAILDESHTVGGDGGGAMFMQYMMQHVGGVTFLSATFAKRADNMPIYAMKTDIAECGVAPDEMIQAIQQGGVTLQEIMSKQLVQSGQMIRRERSFQGVTIDWMPVSDEQSAVQHKQFDEVSGIFSDIRAFQDDYIKPVIEEISDDLADQGSYAGVTQGTEAMGVRNVPFASKMYNLVNQLLFALKADAVADRVIWNLEQGYKPVISFTNTMEGFLGELPKDRPMDEMPNFSLTLLRALDGVMRYTTKDMDQNSEGLSVPLSRLSDEGRARYNEIRQRIVSLSANLPISPMDAIRMKLEQAGYKVGEITGRQTELSQTDDGKYMVRTRTEKDKKAAARGFNEGTIDVLMINKSGSTGISLHSSTKFKDQRQRVMVFAQFQSDINDEVQMRGRIDRTGQVSRGKYEYIVSTIPAEQRLQMMFKSKLKSLDANTTSSQKSKFNEMQVVDFLNKYGDEVVWQYMTEHLELEDKLGDPLKMLASEEDENQRKSRFEGTDNKPGCAAKIARYLPFLPVAEQEEVFRGITEAYAVKMQLLNDAGENDLEITTMPLRAATKSRKVWKEGVAPDSGNAFADNTYLEEVEVDVLRKPMKAAEIKTYSERLTDGKPFDQWKREKLEEVKQHLLEKANGTIERITRQAEERAAKKRAKYVEQAKKYREQGKNQYTDQEIDNLSQMEYDIVMKDNEKKVESHKRHASARYQAIEEMLDMFVPMQPLIIPTNLKDNTGSFVPSYGTFIGFKFNRDFSMSASTAVFATLDGRRKVELPLNSETELHVIQSQSRMQYYALRDISMDNWDSKAPTSTRKTTYIVTGNLLQALVDIQKNEGSSRGTLVTYSTIDGDIRQGILMPDSFLPTDLKQSVGINQVIDRIRNGERVVSSDGDVEVMNYGAYGYRLNVPKSKLRGEKYYGNRKLLNIVHRGEFETRGGQMVGTFDKEDLKKVLDILTKDLGVTVMVESSLTDVRADSPQYQDSADTETVNEGDEVLFRELDDEEDAELIAELENGPTVKTYSTKVKVDDGYIPPMSSKDNETGQMRRPERGGKWNEAEERPDMAYLEEKSGKWKFDLKKSNNKTTGHVDYNPYGHSGSSMLNDQFSEAQSRPDLVVVEMAVPESEVTSGYKAEKANDPVGWKPWKAGPITAKMTGTRQVMLSRWHKITREVPWPEVAQSVARDLGNQFDVLPTNTFPVQLRAELEKLGYQFIETNNKGVIQEGPYKGLTWTDRYYDIHPELDKRKDRKKRAAHTAAVVRANSAQYTDNAESRLRDALVEGGRLAISQGENGKWRIEGMPGEFGSRYAALDEWRERAAGNVVWYLSEDGDYIEVEGNGDMYEMMSADFNAPAASGTPSNLRGGVKQRERMARQQATRSASGRRMVDELADKLGVKVRYVDDMTEEERAQFSERQLRSKGWYNPRTGEVFINLGRHTRLYDILSTFLHETVAHKGLRHLFGKDFNTFLDNVYNNVNKGIRAEIDRMAEQQKSRASEAQRARHDDEHWRRVATEEYMAKLAERLDLNHPEQRTLWEKIRGWLIDHLRKVGVMVADSLNDSDLRGILWESYHNMQMEGVVGYAKGKAFRDQMEREAVNAGRAAAHETTPIAAEGVARYTGSLFDMLPQAGAWASMMSNMSERELFSEMAQDGPNVTSSYSEEYDRRHIKEYNQACDEIQAQLERELPGEDRLLELLQDAEAQWADGAYKDSRRTGVLAAIDTISRALDEERADLPMVEEDVQAETISAEIGTVEEGTVEITNEFKEKMIEEFISDLERNGLSIDTENYLLGGINDIRALKDELDAGLYQHVVNSYNTPYVYGSYDPDTHKVFIFMDKMGGDAKKIKSNMWHENSHHAWAMLPLSEDFKKKAGLTALKFLRLFYPDHYKVIVQEYSQEKWPEEAAVRTVQALIDDYGVDDFFDRDLAVQEKVDKLVAAFKYYYKYEKETAADNPGGAQTQETDETGLRGRFVRGGSTELSGTPETGGEAQGGRADGGVAQSDEDLLFNDSDDGDGTIGAYNRAVNTVGKVVNVAGRDVKPRMTRYNFQEAFQDAILSVKKLQQVVCEAHGLDKLPSKEDAWTYENRLSSINMHARKHFIEKLYEPMMKAHDKLVKHGATVDEITEYVICKHGLERNQVFAERDAQRDANEIARNGGVPDIDALRDQYRQRDYSGLTSITGLDNIADIEADAQRRVDEFEQKHGQLCDELWSRINDATKWTLRRSYDGGMMSAQTYIKVRDMFQHYVPLRGWDETTAEDVYDYIMGDRGAFNGTLKTAMGRTSLADDPFATIGNMGESAIVQGNRNHLKQRLWNMATNHPTDVCKVRDMWVVLDAQGEWIADFPEIPEDADADTIAMILDDHETAMLDLESQDLAKRVRNNLDVGYRIDQRYIPEHAVVVMMNGDRHVVYINGNPRAAQAINGNLSSDKGSKNAIRRLVDFIFKDTRRYYSSVVTSYNINFSGANFVRDLPHAYAMTFTKYGWIKAAKYIVKSFQCIPWVIKNQTGHSGNSNMDQLFREFVAYGGVTGYAHINDIDSWKADNRRRIARLNALGKGTVGTLKGIKAVIHAVGWFSETLELIPRFTTYCASRDMGMDIQSSIKEAKDITTNFNKKGTEMTPGVWGAVANTLRYTKMFFNPIVQGMYQWFDVAKDSKAAKARLTGIMLWMPAMGALIPYLNQFLLAAIGGDDDDDYFLQNEFTRRQNMLIWTGNGYAKIPIAPVFRELYGMGETIATRMCGRIDDMKMAADFVDQLRAAFSLEGQTNYREWSIARAISPEQYAPIVDIMNNENFTGKSLWYESEWNKTKPEYTKAKESTWSPLVNISRTINGWLGGDEDIAADKSGKWLNPVVWQHLLTNYGGGFAQVIGDASSTINNLAHGEPTDVSQWPIAKRFYTQPTEKRANWARYGIYKQYEVEFNKAKDKFSALKKRGLAPLEMAKEISEFAQRHPKAVGVYASWNGGINGADYVQKLKDLREKGDDAAYWATLKEAVEKADYAMRTGYARAWEQKRPSRPEFLDDDELRNTFDNLENDSVRAVMAKEIATRQGVQDYFSHDPYDNYGDEAATYWNAYRRLRLSEDVVEDGKASMLLDDNEKEALKKIKKQLGQGGDDEQIMDEFRRERRRLIEEHDNE